MTMQKFSFLLILIILIICLGFGWTGAVHGAQGEPTESVPELQPLPETEAQPTVTEDTETSGTPDGIRLKILNLNIHNAINWHGEFDLDGLVEFIRETNPDVVTLQEVGRFWRASRYRDLPGELALKLKMFAAFSVSLEHHEGFYGNLILSRFPITRVWAEKLPGILERRSFVMAQFLVEQTRVHILTTHLGLSVADRTKQVKAIFEYTSLVNQRLIITGDLNGGPDDPAVAILREHYSDLGAEEGTGTFRDKNGAVAPVRLDYFFAAPDVQLIRYQTFNNYISDHLAIMAEVIVLPEPEKPKE